MSRAFGLVSCLAAPVAGLALSDPFLGQGTVIQQDVETQIWGTSSESEVHVTLDGMSISTSKVDVDGAWAVTMPAQEAGFNRTLTIIDASGQQSQIVSFGLVIMCAGQSNMDMTVNWPNFRADNGTEECAAAGRYSGGIFLKNVAGRGSLSMNSTKHWFSVTPDTLPYFSAVCWYTGKALYDHQGGQVPIGLIQGENGGTPIEKFLTTDSVVTCNATHDASTCGGKPDQFFYDTIVAALSPYTVGAILWDQAEADVTPTCAHADVYPCLERELVRTWRRGLGGNSPPFIAIQLPGYTGGVAPLSSVFEMRLAQETGLVGVDNAALLPTYDLSCPNCPKGSVHNTDKVDVGARAALQFRRLLHGEGLQAQGHRLANAVTRLTAAGSYEIILDFSGVESHLAFAGTRNCTECCSNPATDFDVSADGSTWVNGTSAKIMDNSTVQLVVNLPSAPQLLRYTASTDFPQCAIYDRSKLPAFPFRTAVQAAEGVTALFTV